MFRKPWKRHTQLVPCWRHRGWWPRHVLSDRSANPHLVNIPECSSADLVEHIRSRFPCAVLRVSYPSTLSSTAANQLKSVVLSRSSSWSSFSSLCNLCHLSDEQQNWVDLWNRTRSPVRKFHFCLAATSGTNAGAHTIRQCRYHRPCGFPRSAAAVIQLCRVRVSKTPFARLVRLLSICLYC